MHMLHELKDMLCEELEEYGKKGELTAGTLDVVDKLTHTIKNLDKIIDKYEEEEYSQAMEGGSYARGGRMSNRGANQYGSYRRGANQYGSYARRGGMGYSREDGYSRNENMVSELYELMENAPDEKTKKEFERFIKKVEMM